MELASRVGAFAVIGALLLRLGGSSLPQKLVNVMADPKVTELILFVETGYRVTQSPKKEFHEAESAPPILKSPLSFSQEDARLVTLHSSAVAEADIPALLTQPLQWNLYGQEPTVLILHTHTTESYTGSYKKEGAYRTLDAQYNMLRVGQALSDALTGAGIGVLHDQTLHDYPSYNGSYAHARESIGVYLEQYPSIRLVIDLHRDAISDGRGNQLAYTCGDTAQLMLVIGTNHENWTENMALAVKLQACLEQKNTGICRPMVLRAQRFNQDLSPGTILIEVGAAGNTLEQAMQAVDPLSKAIIDLAEGTG